MNKTDSATNSELIQAYPEEPASTSSATAKGSAMDDLLGLENSFPRARSEQTNPWGAEAASFGNNPFQPTNPVANSTSDPWGPHASSGEHCDDVLKWLIMTGETPVLSD